MSISIFYDLWFLQWLIYLKIKTCIYFMLLYCQTKINLEGNLVEVGREGAASLSRRLLPGLENLGKRQIGSGPASNVQEQLRELIVDEGEEQFEDLVAACRQNGVEHF
jgi:hypothetical protein